MAQDVIRFLPGNTNSVNAIAGNFTENNSGLFELYNAGNNAVNNNVSIGTLTMIGGIVNIPSLAATPVTLIDTGSVLSQFNPANVAMITPAGAPISGAALITGNGLFSLGGAVRTFDVQAGLPVGMTIQSPIVNGAASAGLTKQNTGTLQLLANNTYTGATNVNGGTLLIDGTQTASAVSVTAAVPSAHGHERTGQRDRQHH